MYSPRGLQDGDAERFREAAVQEDVSANEHAPDARMGHGPEHLHPVVELALLPHLLQEEPLWPVPADDEVEVGVPLAHDLVELRLSRAPEREESSGQWGGGGLEVRYAWSQKIDDLAGKCRKKNRRGTCAERAKSRFSKRHTF